MILAGMNVARLNFSHIDEVKEPNYAWAEKLIARIRKVAAEIGRPLTILADLQGPKIRTVKELTVPLMLSEGETVLVNYPALAHGQDEIKAGDKISGIYVKKEGSVKI